MSTWGTIAWEASDGLTEGAARAGAAAGHPPRMARYLWQELWNGIPIFQTKSHPGAVGKVPGKRYKQMTYVLSGGIAFELQDTASAGWANADIRDKGQDCV